MCIKLDFSTSSRFAGEHEKTVEKCSISMFCIENYYISIFQLDLQKDNIKDTIEIELAY